MEVLVCGVPWTTSSLLEYRSKTPIVNLEQGFYIPSILIATAIDYNGLVF
jgi:hypothetical protein